MTETEYFSRLEMRVSNELAGLRQPELRGWWCDGFIPEKFVVTGKGSHVAGKVWIGNGGQGVWNFVVLLGPRAMRRDEVKWAELLPPDDVTGWLSLDLENEFVKIKAYAGVPDCTPAAR